MWKMPAMPSPSQSMKTFLGFAVCAGAASANASIAVIFRFKKRTSPQ
jgi:hypothetical protein